MDTATLAAGEDVRRMSYAEIAEWRGVSIGAARRLTQRHRWHKQIGNDGFVTVSVPATYFAIRRKPVATTRRSDSLSDSPSDSRSDKPSALDAVPIEAIRTFEKAIDTLTGQLAQAHARADRAEQQRDDATAAERIARDEATGLRAELDARKHWGLWRRVRGR